MSAIRTHFRTCNLCEAMCGLEIKVEGSEILSIKGDKLDVFSKGHICPKALGLKDIYEDPDRLKRPIQKTADGWEEISWPKAIETVIIRLKEIAEKHGHNAVGVYQGNPNVHNMGTLMFGPAFIRSLQTQNRFSATSADQLPHHFASKLMFGHYFLIPIPDVDRTDFMLILGANPMVSNGSLMTAAGIAGRLKAIRDRGGKVVVVDPRKTETANKADRHYFIRPGTDALLLLAMIHVLFEEDRVVLRHLAPFLDGVEALRKLVASFAPSRIAPITGIAEEEILALARDFASAERAVCYGRIGTSTQQFGGLATWLVNVLNIITGNFDRPGGAMFPLPAVDTVATGSKGRMGRWKSRVSDLPEFAGELPVSVLAEEIQTPGPGQIRAMVTSAGNPVLSAPNGKRLDDAFRELDFMVSIDIYLNETTRHADIILPPTTGLEIAHYDLAFHLLAVRNFAKYSPPLFEKQPDQWHDYEIFQALSAGMKGEEPNAYIPEMMLDMGLQAGPYAKDGLTLSRLKAEVHGIDIGPLQPLLPERLFTPDKRISLVPEPMLADIERLQAAYAGTSQNGDLLLIGRRQLRSNNSWMHNSYRLVKGRDRCTLLIHPQDAEALPVVSGEQVKVFSRVGSIRVVVEVSDEVMPGVVSLPHGWGHTHDNIRLGVARQYPGVSVNDLTDETFFDVLTGNAAFSGVPVRIEVE